MSQAPINPTLFQTNAVTNPPPLNNNIQQLPLNPLSANPLLLNNNNPPLQSNNMPFNQTNVPGMLQGNQPTEIAQSAMNVLPPNAAYGWNDPPAFQKTNRITQVSQITR